MVFFKKLKNNIKFIIKKQTLFFSTDTKKKSTLVNTIIIENKILKNNKVILNDVLSKISMNILLMIYIVFFLISWDIYTEMSKSIYFFIQNGINIAQEIKGYFLFDRFLIQMDINLLDTNPILKSYNILKKFNYYDVTNTRFSEDFPKKAFELTKNYHQVLVRYGCQKDAMWFLGQTALGMNTLLPMPYNLNLKFNSIIEVENFYKVLNEILNENLFTENHIYHPFHFMNKEKDILLIDLMTIDKVMENFLNSLINEERKNPGILKDYLNPYQDFFYHYKILYILLGDVNIYYKRLAEVPMIETKSFFLDKIIFPMIYLISFGLYIKTFNIIIPLGIIFSILIFIYCFIRIFKNLKDIYFWIKCYKK